MMSIVENIDKALIVLLAVPSLYLLATTVASYMFRPQKAESNRFLNVGVLIAAHNEERSIGATITSVFGCDYPANRYEVYVIADNCTDGTAGIARDAGARVFERTDSVRRGKGAALDWFIKNHQEAYRHTDAMTIIDADVNVDRDYLREISASLSTPEVRVVQAYNGVSNPAAGWRPALIDAAFNVFNHLRLAGAIRLSGAGVLKGNGMAFETGLLRKYGWPCHSIVEDLEFTLRLLQDGIRVHYNPDAVVRSEMVTSGSNATSQRNRWEGGRFMLARTMTPHLLRLLVKNGDPVYLFAWAELALPPLALLVLLALLAGGLGLQLGGAWMLGALTFWPILFAYVVSGQIQRGAPRSTWAYLLAAPAYVLWKIPIYAAMFFRKQGSAWVRTARENRATY